MEANRLENPINHSDEKSGNRNPIEFQETTLQSDMFDIALPPGYVVDELPRPSRPIATTPDTKAKSR